MKIIPPFKLVPVPLGKEVASPKPFKVFGGDAGIRHQLEGKCPICPCCEQDMLFYALVYSNNDAGDFDITCIFVCFNCEKTNTFYFPAESTPVPTSEEAIDPKLSNVPDAEGMEDRNQLEDKLDSIPGGKRRPNVFIVGI